MPAHPFDVIEYRGRAQYSAFAPGSSQLTVVVLSFCILFFIIWPNCSTLAVTFSPLGILSILLLEAMSVQLQALHQRVPGPRSQPGSD